MLAKAPQFIRKTVFWAIDGIKGSSIKSQYKDIKGILDSRDIDFITQKQNEALKAILDHAITTSTFYKDYVGYNSISDFPIINKNIIRDNFDAFKSSKYKLEECILVSTSGSTGTPFKVLQNKRKRLRNLADNLCFFESSGYEIGQKLINIKIWPDKLNIGLFSKFWFKNMHPQSVFKLSDDDLNVLIKTLQNDSAPKSMIGYPSAFETICRYLDKVGSGPVSCNLYSIISMSEVLKENIRNKMETYFGVTPMSRYSNNENGIIAQETMANKFKINHASYYIEVLKVKEDMPADYGELGRIVITDLYNYAMPLIRYDIGDIGVIDRDENNIPYLKSVEGRKLDLIFNTKGEIIPSYISYKLGDYGDCKQFQLIQYGKRHYKIKLNTDKKVDEPSMLKDYKQFLGEDAIIDIEYVDEIPLLLSGKRREVLNTYYKEKEQT